MILFEDECSISNTATVSYGWSEKGKQPLVRCKQKKRESETFFGSVDIDTGKVVAQSAKRGNYQTFKKYLKKVLYEYRNKKKIILCLDNVRYHHAKLLNSFLEKQPKLDLMYLPAYSPDFNPMERIWWFMRKSITHNRYIETLEERKIKFWKMFSHFQNENDISKNLCNLCVFN